MCEGDRQRPWRLALANPSPPGTDCQPTQRPAHVRGRLTRMNPLCGRPRNPCIIHSFPTAQVSESLDGTAPVHKACGGLKPRARGAAPVVAAALCFMTLL